MHVNWDLHENFGVGKGVTEGCVMYPLQFSIYMDEWIKGWMDER